MVYVKSWQSNVYTYHGLICFMWPGPLLWLQTFTSSMGKAEKELSEKAVCSRILS